MLKTWPRPIFEENSFPAENVCMFLSLSNFHHQVGLFSIQLVYYSNTKVFYATNRCKVTHKNKDNEHMAFTLFLLDFLCLDFTSLCSCFSNNPATKERKKQGLWDIPFVKEINGRK